VLQIVFLVGYNRSIISFHSLDGGRYSSCPLVGARAKSLWASSGDVLHSMGWIYGRWGYLGQIYPTVAPVGFNDGLVKLHNPSGTVGPVIFGCCKSRIAFLECQDTLNSFKGGVLRIELTTERYALESWEFSSGVSVPPVWTHRWLRVIDSYWDKDWGAWEPEPLRSPAR
jgi:hypothetical protein